MTASVDIHAGYPCPACGFVVFGGPPGSFEICDVCEWEDDPVQLSHPTMAGGANSESLLEAQRRSLTLVPLVIRAHAGIARDPAWRPLQPGDLGLDGAVGFPRNGLQYFEAVGAAESSLYYWQVSGPQSLESILRDAEERATGEASFSLWIPEQLCFKNQVVAQDWAMALVLDRLLARGLFPAGFEQHPGGRVYRYAAAG